jgi:hypothetical protein
MYLPGGKISSRPWDGMETTLYKLRIFKGDFLS